jgi:hypothetical protein
MLRVHRIPFSTSVTIASRPSCETRRGGLVEMICLTTQGEFFQVRLERPIRLKLRGEIRFLAQKNSGFQCLHDGN